MWNRPRASGHVCNTLQFRQRGGRPLRRPRRLAKHRHPRAQNPPVQEPNRSSSTNRHHSEPAASWKSSSTTNSHGLNRLAQLFNRSLSTNQKSPTHHVHHSMRKRDPARLLARFRGGRPVPNVLGGCGPMVPGVEALTVSPPPPLFLGEPESLRCLHRLDRRRPATDPDPSDISTDLAAVRLPAPRRRRSPSSHASCAFNAAARASLIGSFL